MCGLVPEKRTRYGCDCVSQGHDKNFFDQSLVVHNTEPFPICDLVICCEHYALCLSHSYNFRFKYILDVHEVQEHVVKCDHVKRLL